MDAVGLMKVHLHLPGCSSLKEKRSRIRPIIARLHREFNVSTAELDQLEAWQESVLGFTTLANDAVHVRRVLEEVLTYLETHWPDEQVVDHRVEIL